MESHGRCPVRVESYGKTYRKISLLDYYTTQLMCSKCRNPKTRTQNFVPEQCDCKNIRIQVKGSSWSLERKLYKELLHNFYFLQNIHSLKLRWARQLLQKDVIKCIRYLRLHINERKGLF